MSEVYLFVDYLARIFVKISWPLLQDAIMNLHMEYYNVQLGVKRHWKSSSYIYSGDSGIQPGTVVKVPFGPKKMNGYIESLSKKPSFNVKPIHKVIESCVPGQTIDFIQWFSDYYGGQGGQATAQLMPSYLTSPKKTPASGKKTKIFAAPPKPSTQQQNVIAKINSQETSVLHGITGSGKTRIYISLLSKAAGEGKNSLLLYPEISLTKQLLDEISEYANVIAFHSGLSNAQRSRLWFKVANSKEPITVIGPRSALFLPHSNLGVIIVDEAHESSYKQDSDIRYNSLMVAGGLRKSHGCKLVMGSATPPVAETTYAQSKKGGLVCLHKKAIESPYAAEVLIINKKDKSLFRKHYLLSDKLLASMKESLDSGKQSLLFLNKRGTAKLMVCSECEWQADCSSCDLPFTYHHDTHILSCHTCNAVAKPFTACPLCRSEIKLGSFGGKAIVQEVQKIFPGAKIGRFDSDTSKEDSFSEKYTEIKAGGIDILIGTQQIVKGLDLPLLQTVGIISADLSLNFPDYSSDERTFQLVSQAAGRVGRGHTKGEVFIQTFQPSNPVIQLAAKEDWHTFYDSELKNRKKYGFPPSIHLAKIIFRNQDAAKANKEALKLKHEITTIPGIQIAGPIESIPFKRNNHYYLQLNLKSKSRNKLVEASKLAPASALFELDPISLI